MSTHQVPSICFLSVCHMTHRLRKKLPETWMYSIQNPRPELDLSAHKPKINNCLRWHRTCYTEIFRRSKMIRTLQRNSLVDGCGCHVYRLQLWSPNLSVRLHQHNIGSSLQRIHCSPHTKPQNHQQTNTCRRGPRMLHQNLICRTHF